MSCSCGRTEEYQNCCEPYIKGDKRATTAEEMMRSRYSAFTHNEMEYIESTHHPKTAKDLDMDANRRWAKNAEWLGLEIVSVENGGEEDKKGFVEFKAKFKMKGKTTTHHEMSEFRKEAGQWKFYDAHDLAAETYVRAEPKIGRNDPCTCGSGKKYKKCCGAH